MGFTLVRLKLSTENNFHSKWFSPFCRIWRTSKLLKASNSTASDLANLTNWNSVSSRTLSSFPCGPQVVVMNSVRLKSRNYSYVYRRHRSHVRSLSETSDAKPPMLLNAETVRLRPKTTPNNRLKIRGNLRVFCIRVVSWTVCMSLWTAGFVPAQASQFAC